MEAEKKKLQKDVQDSQVRVDQVMNKFHTLKSEVEDSPLQTLRQEIGQK